MIVVPKRDNPMAPRSNRPLTQFACSHLSRCLSTDIGHSYSDQKGNTRVVYINGPVVQNVQILLCDQVICSILTACQESPKVISMRFSIGTELDSAGNPLKTTIERLNGILDNLGSHRALPQGVRVFYNKDEKCYALGKGDDYVTLGASRICSVMIKPSPDRFLPELLLRDTEQ